MEESLVMDRIRDLFTMLDRMVYSLISVFYNTISDLASVQLLSTTTISEITSRVYALLGIFMLFKVSFSLINYIIDPEKIADKAKGGGPLIRNIVITFALIVTVPFGFNLLYEAQSAILSDQIIPTLVFGTEASLTDTDNTYKIYMDGCEENAAETNNMGDYIGLAIFKPFFIRETENFKALDPKIDEYYCAAGGTNNDASVNKLLLKSDLYNAPHGWSTTHNYNFNYSFIISTGIGIFVGFIFLSFCFDIAARTLKLLFLEIIAPVPIISFIDPDSSKNTMFKKWIKEVFNTWVSLFIRLISVFLAIYIIQQVTSEDGKLYFLEGYNFGGNMIWLKLLIIIGILIFAKQLPKIIEDIIGLKAGGLALNPFKNIGDNALGGKALIATGAGIAGAAGGGIAGFRAGIQAGAPGRGLALGMVSGFNNGKGDPKKAFSSGMNKTYKSLTGNEMSTMTPSRMLMGVGNNGAKSVDQMKDHLKTARSRHNAEQTRLNQASHHNAIASEKLRSAGVNLSDLGSARQSMSQQMNESAAARSGLSEKLSNSMNSLESARNNYNSANDIVKNFKPSMIYDNGSPIYSKEYTDAKSLIEQFNNSNTLSSLESEYNRINSEYQDAETSYNNAKANNDAIDSYESTLKEEETIRGNISKIEKEISTLGDEKKQRETFWQVDTSTKTSVDEAMNNNPVSK